MKKVGYLLAYAGSKNIFWNDLLSDKEENSRWCTVKSGKHKNMIFKIKDDNNSGEEGQNEERSFKRSD